MNEQDRATLARCISVLQKTLSDDAKINLTVIATSDALVLKMELTDNTFFTNMEEFK